ncbi:four helix bundle protein [Patescibacteria group bacterium AH-259-L07]|nr:four helix bundle protein [Patescibacteria group bacterium AH-259-L07]
MRKDQNKNFFDELKKKMDDYVHFIFKISRKFPKEEIYITTNQLKRSSLSIILNFIEGFARQRKAVKKNFWETAYGSLKESKYLLHFSLKESFLNKEDYKNGIRMADEIGAMLWRAIKSLK